MYGSDQIGSTLGNFIDAVLHPSVANLPAGFLVLVFAGGPQQRMRFGPAIARRVHHQIEREAREIVGEGFGVVELVLRKDLPIAMAFVT